MPYPEGDDNPWKDWPRNTTPLLAQKLGYKIRDYWRLNEGLEFPLNGPGDALYTKTVLSRTYMASAITEASFICDPLEAYRFYNDPSHAENEGYAIINGWLSYWYGQGLAIVEYECYPTDLGYGQDLMLGEECADWYQYETPYYGCWRAWPYSETYCLYAPNYSAEGYDYTFHHWEFRDWLTGELYDTDWSPSVWLTVEEDFDDSTHYYVAYFTGGPFDVTLKYPTDTTTEIQKNDSITIEWWAPEGVKFSWSGGAIYTCSLTIDFSTNGMGTWQQIAGPIPYNNGYQKVDQGKYDWLVPNVTSNNCYLRLIAWDRADNHDTLISHRFGIDCYTPTAQFYANKYSGEMPLTVQFYDQSTHYPTGWSWNFGDGGTSTAMNPTHIYDSAGVYTVSLTATNQCGSDDTVMVSLIEVICGIVVDFSANTTSGVAPLDVVFFDESDPPGWGNYYLWDFGDGDTSLEWQVTQHEYDTPGKYTVSLTVGLPCGALDDTVKTCLIEVQDSSGAVPDSEGRVAHSLLWEVSVLKKSPPFLSFFT